MSGSEKIKYLDEDEVRRLRLHCENKAIVDVAKGRRTGVVEWLVIDIGSSLGLRASEIRNLLVGDVHLGAKGFLAVRTLKRRKAVVDHLPLEGSLKEHIRCYLDWKKAQGESMEADAPLILSNKGCPFSLRGVEHLVKRVMGEAGLDERFSAHSLRHTAAVHLLRKSGNLRLCQKVLRHASVQTTSVYADVMEGEIREQLSGLFAPAVLPE